MACFWDDPKVSLRELSMTILFVSKTCPTGWPILGRALACHVEVVSSTSWEKGLWKDCDGNDPFTSAPGTVDQPVILDDSDLHSLTPAQVKSLFDVTARQTMVKVRYTATKFVAGQVRIGCDNLYNEIAAKDLTAGQINLSTFWDLIKPAFNPSFRGAHIGALFKRASIFVNTTTHFVAKIHGQEFATVIDLPTDGTTYLKMGASTILDGFFTHGIERKGLVKYIEEEQEMMGRLVAAKTEELQRQMHSERVFNTTDFKTCTPPESDPTSTKPSDSASTKPSDSASTKPSDASEPKTTTASIPSDIVPVVPLDDFMNEEIMEDDESEPGSVQWSLDDIMNAETEMRSPTGSDISHPISIRSNYSPAVTPLVLSDMEDI
eukprot:6465811-Amphidinium_carterae.1